MARPRRTRPGVEVATAEKMAEALRLRGDESRTYADIGNALGVSESYARRLVEMALDQMLEEPAKRARQFELRRMRRAAVRIEKLSETFDPKELATLTSALCKVSERIARLQGLDAPTKVDLKDRRLEEMTIEELRQVLAEVPRGA